MVLQATYPTLIKTQPLPALIVGNLKEKENGRFVKQRQCGRIGVRLQKFEWRRKKDIHDLQRRVAEQRNERDKKLIAMPIEKKKNEGIKIL